MKLTFVNNPVNYQQKDKIVPGADCAVCHGGCCGTNNGRTEDDVQAVLERNSTSGNTPKYTA